MTPPKHWNVGNSGKHSSTALPTPDRLREVFSSRLLDEVPAAEICKVLGISATNQWALMHRARVRLWRCLDQTGFGPSAAEE